MLYVAFPCFCFVLFSVIYPGYLSILLHRKLPDSLESCKIFYGRIYYSSIDRYVLLHWLFCFVFLLEITHQWIITWHLCLFISVQVYLQERFLRIRIVQSKGEYIYYLIDNAKFPSVGNGVNLYFHHPCMKVHVSAQPSQ